MELLESTYLHRSPDKLLCAVDCVFRGESQRRAWLSRPRYYD